MSNASMEEKIAKSNTVLNETDDTIERELWGGDQANTKHEERAARELYRRRTRIAELEAIVRRYHDWHLKNDGENGGYLESGLYEDACAAVPGLALIGKN
jgi:hypothetical protein